MFLAASLLMVLMGLVEAYQQQPMPGHKIVITGYVAVLLTRLCHLGYDLYRIHQTHMREARSSGRLGEIIDLLESYEGDRSKLPPDMQEEITMLTARVKLQQQA